MPTRSSIRRRLALSAIGLVLAVVAAIAGVAYREVRAAAKAQAGEHLQGVSRQLADLLGASARQMTGLAAGVASDSAVERFVRDPNPAVSDAALGSLKPLVIRGATGSNVEIWSASGTRLLSTADLPDLPEKTVRSLLAKGHSRADERTGATAAFIGPIDSVGDHLAYQVVAPIEPRGAREPIGYVVQRRLLGASQQSAQILALIGPKSKLLVGNTGGPLWTDFSRAIMPPPVDPGRPGAFVEYESQFGGAMILAATAIPNTPWSIAVESPRSLALATAHDMLWRLAMVTLLLVLFAAAGTWALSGTLTKPIRDLAEAADAFSAGDYSKRLDAKGGDELGAVSTMFNTMADRIAASVGALRNKVRELHATEARYRLLFDASPLPKWVYDLETLRFLAVNDAAVRRYGYTREQFLKMTILDIRPTDDVPALLEDLARLGPEHGAQAELWRHRTASGEIMDVEVNSRPIDFDGRPARMVIVNDLTERRQAEESARAASQRLERVIASSGAVLYELRLGEAEPVLEWISDNIVRVLGYTSAEAYEPGWWTSRVHPDDLARLNQSQGAAGFRDGANEYRFRASSGAYRWVRDEQRVIEDARTGTRKVVGAWIDITDQRQLEQQFLQAQKMEAVGRLAGGVAHDFNNLLTVMMSESQLLMSDPVMQAGDRAESVAEIHKAGERAALLTKQLLSFSRQQLLETEAIDVNDVVRNVDAMLRRLIGEDLELRLHLMNAPATALADRGQIEQVIMNLAVNARDAMPDGGTLTVETSRVDLDDDYCATRPDLRPGPYLLLAVSDTGSGMTEDVQAHVFEPFFTTKEPGKGTGLGLATCFAIVRQFRGHIGIYSEVGIGTTMKVYLPLIAPSGSDGEERQPQRVERGSETVLLVEDEPSVRRVTARMLTALGYDVLQAGDADEASASFEAHAEEIQLLITDVVLPRVGGRELADRLVGRKPTLRVLFMSGYSDDVVLQHRLAEHDVLLVQKPFTNEALATKVRMALGPRAA